MATQVGAIGPYNPMVWFTTVFQIESQCGLQGRLSPSQPHVPHFRLTFMLWQ